MAQAERIIEGIALIIIWIFAFFGNISLWIIIFRTRGLREQSYYMILILSCADIFVSVISMPITVYTIFAGDWMLSHETCTSIGFLTMLTFIASVMSLGCISLNRYVKICLAHYYSRVYTTRHVVFMAVGVWSLSFALALPPLIGWGRYDFLPNQSFCFCDWKSSQTYTIFMIAVCFGGPCAVMTFCYVNILRIFRSSTKRLFGSGRSVFSSGRCLGKVSPDPSTVSHGKIEIKIESVNPVDDANETADDDVKPEVSSLNHNKLEVGSLNHNKPEDDSVNHNKPEVGSLNHNKPEVDSVNHNKPEVGFLNHNKPEVDSVNHNKPEVNSLKRNKQECPSRNLLTVDSYRISTQSIQERDKQQEKRQSRRKQDEYMLAVSLLLVIFVFIICWLPFCITMFLNVFSTVEVPRPADMFTLLLGYANSCCNPFIYGFMNKRFKIGYRRLFRDIISASCKNLSADENSDETALGEHSHSVYNKSSQ